MKVLKSKLIGACQSQEPPLSLTPPSYVRRVIFILQRDVEGLSAEEMHCYERDSSRPLVQKHIWHESNQHKGLDVAGVCECMTTEMSQRKYGQITRCGSKHGKISLSLHFLHFL